MGKANYNKMMEDRISGMTYAWDFIKQNGMEAFEKELRFRKATFVQLEVDKERCDLIFDQCVTRMYNTFITAVTKVLNESYGFGGKRLREFFIHFNHLCEDMCMTDCYGERYFTMADYAKEFNDKYHLGIDLDKVQTVDALNDKTLNHSVDLQAVADMLRMAGYKDAAAFIDGFKDAEAVG